MEALTKDHSKVNELIDVGKMREDEVKTAEIQSMITRALGINAKGSEGPLDLLSSPAHIRRIPLLKKDLGVCVYLNPGFGHPLSLDDDPPRHNQCPGSLTARHHPSFH